MNHCIDVGHLLSQGIQAVAAHELSHLVARELSQAHHQVLADETPGARHQHPA
jgi:hypothetical protein